MRFIIYGIGAIGGTLAVCLARAGYEILGIARGAQLDVVQADGLKLRTPDGDILGRFPTVGHPSEINFRPDDTILLTMKSQHTEDALHALRAAGVRTQTIACMQNGVANERLASRYFDAVLGGVVMMPATYLKAGEVITAGTPKHGLFDIGCYPQGTSHAVKMLCDALNAAEFGAFAHADVMRAKYGKLLLNLANGIDAALGVDGRDSAYMQSARQEALAVYAKAGIDFDDVGTDEPRRKRLMQIGEVSGAPRIGSSATQSLARHAGSIETDYLNGEIALLGRLYGVPTPVNACFAALAADLSARGVQPGSMTVEQIEAELEKY